MEIDAEIEKIFSKKFPVSYFEKENKKESGNMNFSAYEIMIQGKPVDGKIKTDKTIAYPEITCLIINNENEIVLDLSEKNSKLTITVEEPLYVVKCIFVAFKLFFPCEDVFSFLPIKNSSSLSIDEVKEEVKNTYVHIQSPCNNFSYGVKFFAKYKYLPENEEIIWDIDTVYANKETNLFVLKDFDHLKPKFLSPVLGAMCYNTFFTELSLSFVDLTPYEKLLERVFKFNKKFKKLFFDGCNLKLSLCTAIVNGLMGQKYLKCIDFSNNEGIGDKGVEIITPFLKKSSRTLEVLKMSKCNLTSVSLSRIADAFTYNIKGNEDSLIELKVLDLSNNPVRDNFKEIFFFFLQKCNHLEDLNLSNMNCSIEMIAASLTLGPSKSLKYLDLSENITPASTKSSTQWSTFFKNAKSLSRISICNFKFLHCAITDGLMLGLEANSTLSLTGVEVIVSNNNFNLENFSKFADFIYKAKSVTLLDISSNGLGLEFLNLLNKLPEFHSLKSLNINNNFLGLKPKEVQTILTQMTCALQLESVNLQELYMANCNFGGSLSTLISELDSFFSLRVLDISGNNIGNVVGRTIGRMLTIDKHIKEIMLDNNNITKEIYEEILDGLVVNYTLSVFHVPFIDLVKYPPKMVIPIIEKINKHHIKVNKIYQGVSFEEIKAMAFSCIMNQTSENIDKCKSALQESCNRLKNITTVDDSLTAQISRCLTESQENVKSMEASKDLMSKLNSIYKINDNASLLTDLRIKNVIERTANDVASLMNEYMAEVVEEMMKEVWRTLPYLMSTSDELQNELKKTCSKIMEIPREYLLKLFSRFIESNLLRKVYETQSNVTNAICDNITDRILTDMNTCDIQANRLISSSRNAPQSQKSMEDKSASGDIDRPVIRSNDDKKRDQVMSVRTSRLSHLAASKARPLSKALKKTSTEDDSQSPTKPSRPFQTIPVSNINLGIENVEDSRISEEFKDQSPHLEVKPIAPTRIKRLLTVTEGNHDDYGSQEYLSVTSTSSEVIKQTENMRKEPASVHETGGIFSSQTSLNSSASSRLKAPALPNKPFKPQMSSPGDEKSHSQHSLTNVPNERNLKASNLSLKLSKSVTDQPCSEKSNPEGSDVLTTLKQRPKPNRKIKPTMISPTITSVESSPMSNDSLDHFHQPLECEPDTVVKSQTKKKSFFSLAKGKAQAKMKVKNIDLDDIRAELSSSASDCEEIQSHVYVKKKNSKENNASRSAKK